MLSNVIDDTVRHFREVVMKDMNPHFLDYIDDRIVKLIEVDTRLLKNKLSKQLKPRMKKKQFVQRHSSISMSELPKTIKKGRLMRNESL